MLEYFICHCNSVYIRRCFIRTRWYKNAVVYQIYPRSLNDSNGAGIGDINGITKRLITLKILVWMLFVFHRAISYLMMIMVMILVTTAILWMNSEFWMIGKKMFDASASKLILTNSDNCLLLSRSITFSPCTCAVWEI